MRGVLPTILEAVTVLLLTEVKVRTSALVGDVPVLLGLELCVHPVIQIDAAKNARAPITLVIALFLYNSVFIFLLMIVKVKQCRISLIMW